MVARTLMFLVAAMLLAACPEMPPPKPEIGPMVLRPPGVTEPGERGSDY